MTWTANDSSNNRAAGVNDSFIVNNSVNFTPTIPNQQLQVGQSITPFDLDSFFTDPDGDTLTFSVTGTGTSLITIATGGSVTITGTSSGTFTVVFSATDGINSVSSNTVTITVTSTDEGRRFGGGGGGGGGGNRTVFGAPAEFPEEILEPALAPISPEAPEEEAIPSEASEEGEPLRLPIPLAESIAGIERFGLAIRDGVTGVVRAVQTTLSSIGSSIRDTAIAGWASSSAYASTSYLGYFLLALSAIALLFISRPYAAKGIEHLRGRYELNQQIHTLDLSTLGTRSKRPTPPTPKEHRPSNLEVEIEAEAQESLLRKALRRINPSSKKGAGTEIKIDTSLDIDTTLHLDKKRKR